MHHSKAIILSNYNFKENDKIINFYTRDFGKKELLAIGARKINSKLNPHLQYFTVLEICFVKGRNLDRLTSASIKENYFKINSSLKAIALGNFCLGVIDQLIKSSHPDESIFDLITELFELLNKDLKKNHLEDLLISIFLMRFLSFLGYAPELYICLKCKNKAGKEGNFFSFKRGGLVCAKCHQEDGASQAISAEAIKILRLFLSEELEVAEKIKAPKEILRQVNKITINFLAFHLEPTAKSEQLLKWAITRL
ncbi:MAG: DNA repair protein RecO (recombination protein O) [Parcubacteria group bacterium Athens1014_10]|nr:MAG: DNA repair protein RecO (recombination protein O) [Parcubacteria group bacterium Athens1014_10]TSD05007.1 MAG: DNA repair protein RecO (recombination protein O) [Parcubacteria group bacterium Athens0714_12]